MRAHILERLPNFDVLSFRLLMANTYQTVFSPPIVSCQLSPLHRHYYCTTFVTKGPRRTSDGYQAEGGCRSRGQGCQCATREHESSWRRREQQHNAEYVLQVGISSLGIEILIALHRALHGRIAWPQS